MNPIGALLAFPKAALACICILLLSSPASALFLAAQGEGGKILVLCEGQSEAYLSSPNGSLARLMLNSSFQAEFSPNGIGPHTVQCGREAKTIGVQLEQGGAIPDGKTSMLLFASLAAFAILMLLLFAAFAHFILRQKVHFTKHVQGSHAKLSLRSGMPLSSIEISDPVAVGHEGEALCFKIERLAPGQAWCHEYEIAKPRQALPASLSAQCKNGEVAHLSQLFIDGASSPPSKGERKGGGKRSLPKAT